MGEPIIDEVDLMINGFSCKILWVRDHYCGYVALPKSHRYYGLRDELEIEAPVHGGVTFAGTLKFKGKERFCLGFDCAHSVDSCQPKEQVEGKNILPANFRTFGHVFYELQYFTTFLSEKKS